MAVESTSGIWSLDPTLPLSTDDVSEGDDHIRAVKSTITRTFPNISATVNATHQELNYMSGVTSAVQGQINTISASLQTAISDIAALSSQAAVAYGGLVVAAVSEFTASTSLSAYTGWDAGMPTSNVTVNTANGSLSPDLTGVYEVMVQVSFSGQASTQFDGVVHVDDVALNVGFSRQLGTGGDVGSAFAGGLFSANAGAIVKVRISSDAADSAFRVQRGQFVIARESS